MTLESIARTIAKARHGTDAHWANYVPSARAVVDMLLDAADEAKPKREDLFAYFYHDADGLEENACLDPEEALVAFRAIIRAILAQPDGAQ